MPLKKAEAGRTKDGKRTVTYYDHSGRKVRTHVGGDRSVRNNNPGNITWDGKKKDSFAERHGAIGSDGDFAIFPDVETGRQARRKLLEGPSYQNHTLDSGIDYYDSDSPKEIRESYKRNVSEWSGIARDRMLGDLSEEEQDALFKAMERQEGYTDKHGNVRNPSEVIDHTEDNPASPSAKSGPGEEKRAPSLLEPEDGKTGDAADAARDNAHDVMADSLKHPTLNDVLARPEETWSQDELNLVHARAVRLGPSNPEGLGLYERVRARHDHFYGPGPVEYDATGRMIDPKPIRPIPMGGGMGGGGPVHVRSHARDGGKTHVDAYDRSRPSG